MLFKRMFITLVIKYKIIQNTFAVHIYYNKGGINFEIVQRK